MPVVIRTKIGYETESRGNQAVKVYSFLPIEVRKMKKKELEFFFMNFIKKGCLTLSNTLIEFGIRDDSIYRALVYFHKEDELFSIVYICKFSSQKLNKVNLIYGFAKNSVIYDYSFFMLNNYESVKTLSGAVFDIRNSNINPLFDVSGKLLDFLIQCEELTLESYTQFLEGDVLEDENENETKPTPTPKNTSKKEKKNDAEEAKEDPEEGGSV